MQYNSFPYLFQSLGSFGILVTLEDTQTFFFSNSPKDRKTHESEWDCMNVTYQQSFITDCCELDPTFINVHLVCKIFKNVKSKKGKYLDGDSIMVQGTDGVSRFDDLLCQW